jgi:hypothetical protein
MSNPTANESARAEINKEQRARRAARRAGLTARKSRHTLSLRNQGGFLLIDERNVARYGSDFDLTADDVIEICGTI